MAVKIWIAIILSVVLAGAAAEDPVVKLKQGAIRGSVLTSDENKPINSFRGIPYAKPPVKHLRFKRSEPAEPWSGIFDGTEDGATCIQFDALQQRYTGDEDCLFLNVYVPQIDDKKKKEIGPLPVMAFFHGGGFVWGSGKSNFYGPQRLVDRDVILVTLNYRVAALGFLSTADEAAPGNYGFYDQVQGLKWIQENIGSFGGDPKRVTIFGESAGSISVVLHVLSPLSAGLFHAAIGQSGSPLCGFGIAENPMKFTTDLAKELGCPTEDNELLVSCIRKRPAIDIVVHSTKIEANNFMNLESEKPFELPYGAVPERAGKNGLPFLTEDFSEQLAKGNFNKVPVILGVNRDEGLMLYAANSLSLKKQGRDQAEAVVSKVLHSIFPQSSEEKSKKVYDMAYNSYFADKTDDEMVTKELVQFYGDVIFHYCTDLTTQKLAAGGIPVYPYQFTYARPEVISLFRPTEPYLEKDTVIHADELPYIFRCEIFPGTNTLKNDDLLVSDLLVTLWTNFAKTRHPSLDDARFDHPEFQWKTYSSPKPRFLNLALAPAMQDGHICSRTPLWLEMAAVTPKRDKKDEL